MIEMIEVGALQLSEGTRSNRRGELSLAGWRLDDRQGNIFFPMLTL
jgi:hypothetical protein